MEYVVTVEDARLNEALTLLATATASPFTTLGLGEPLYKDFREIEQDWFQSAGEGSWPPDAESTIERKLRAGFGAVAEITIMRFTDRLYFSLTREGHEDAIKEILPAEVRFGTSVPYATSHMEATGNRPARPPIPKELPEAARLKMEATIHKAAGGYTNELGFMGYTQTSIFDFV